jgi:hypothetical protein
MSPPSCGPRSSNLPAGSAPSPRWKTGFRELAGATPYDTDFVAHYLLPLLYPAALTRNLQIFLGILVLSVNVGIYGWLLWRARQTSAGCG